MEKYYKEIQEKIGRCYQNELCGKVIIEVPRGKFDIVDDIVNTYRKIGYTVHATTDNDICIYIKNHK